jgi:hypothetical protein
MRTYLLLAVGLALASCSTTKPKAAPVAAEHVLLLPTDTARVPHVPPIRTGFLGLLFPSKKPTPVATAQVPRKVKGNLTINYVQGNQSNQRAGKKGQVLGDGASVKGDTKAKGSAAVSQDSSTQNALTGAGNQSAIKGNNNATTQTKQDTSKEAPGPLAVLANNATAWLPWVLGAVAVGCVGYGIYYFWFLIPRRKSAANQA